VCYSQVGLTALVFVMTFLLLFLVEFFVFKHYGKTCKCYIFSIKLYGNGNKPIHLVTSRVFGYTATCTNEQYVGTVQMTHDEIVDKLAESQFNKNFVSALKYRNGQEIADSSWLYRSSLFF